MSIELLALQKRDRDEVVGLFTEYPFKAHQKQVQNIDEHRLAQLLWDLSEPLIEKPDARGLLARRLPSEEPVGLSLLTAHPWHSEIFRRRMGRIEHFVNYRDPERAGPPLLEGVLEAARDMGLEHLSCRVDGCDWPNVQLLEAHGFRCVDCSLKMVRALDDLRAKGATRPPAGIEIRPYAHPDLSAVQEIAARSHVRNHFYNDPELMPDRAADLFREWVKRCATRLADFVLVAQDADTKPVGFIIALRNAALARVVGTRVGIVDYIVVDQKQSGKGIGRALLDAALRRMADDHDWAELRTSHDNYGAVAFYNRTGFRTVASDFVFHWWAKPSRTMGNPGLQTASRQTSRQLSV